MNTDSHSRPTTQHRDRWRALLASFDSTATKAHVHEHNSLIDGYLLALLDGGLTDKLNYERLTKAAEDFAQAAEQAALQDHQHGDYDAQTSWEPKERWPTERRNR